MKRTVTIALLLLVCLVLHAQAPLPSAATVEVGFSPGGTALAVVEKAINSARSEILMAAYEFTSREIADALEAAAHRGVKVRIVADWKASHDRSSRIGAVKSTGLPVRLDEHYSIFHHKFLVIDGVTLETGSFNYTEAAIRHNAENALVLWNAPQVAAVYTKEWERLWEESK